MPLAAGRFARIRSAMSETSTVASLRSEERWLDDNARVCRPITPSKPTVKITIVTSTSTSMKPRAPRGVERWWFSMQCPSG